MLMVKNNVLNVQITLIVQILQKHIVFQINVSLVKDLNPLSVKKIISLSVQVQPNNVKIVQAIQSVIIQAIKVLFAILENALDVVQTANVLHRQNLNVSLIIVKHVL